ncbi:chemotaxis protein [Methylococcaceae bacterium HT4]|nr:chemotaxis protein [Methylococcaceae bacterium HT4]TXL20424.1 chemotaxis protein [Methylococcaceae bacterium HT5]
MAEITYTGTIISDTDKKGIITSANDVFQEVAGYSEDELVGANHNIVRHDDMPRACFKLVWDTISSGKEIRAFVINKAKNGDHYWVLAHITPTADGYHAERQAPNPAIINDVVVAPLYKQMRDKEKEMNYSNEGMEAATQILLDVLTDKGLSYDELIDALA